jgi:MFS family permease
MSWGFGTILTAQFLSALGDNALMFAAIALLKTLDAPEWQTPVLQQFFVLSFIFLAPFVGTFADALPKGNVMFISNSIKLLGCAAMLLGLHPLLAYGFVGIGAALYSPAKYGILTEYLPRDRLVWANSWMEGLTVAAVILGAIFGGFLVGAHVEESVFGRMAVALHIDSVPLMAILVILLVYLLAAVVNLFIPHLPVERPPEARSAVKLFKAFLDSFLLLWKDPLGQVSLAVTSLFWGVGTTLRLIILAWAAINLGMDLEAGTKLTALVAVGLAIGSVLAAKSVVLEDSEKVLPLGVAMGILVVTMIWVHDLWIAALILIAIGVLAGVFVIPMNALLQYRGHQLMGSGHSIAVQNFNENLSILGMLGGYALMIRMEISASTIVVVFGLLISLTMYGLSRSHRNDPI